MWLWCRHINRATVFLHGFIHSCESQDNWAFNMCLIVSRLSKQYNIGYKNVLVILYQAKQSTQRDTLLSESEKAGLPWIAFGQNCSHVRTENRSIVVLFISHSLNEKKVKIFVLSIFRIHFDWMLHLHINAFNFIDVHFCFVCCVTFTLTCLMAL